MKILKEKNNSKLYPSRILNLGIYIIISNCQDLKGRNESETNKIISDIFEKLNLSINKAEKDIGIYKSTISKMLQAKELIEELRLKIRKKIKKIVFIFSFFFYLSKRHKKCKLLPML